MVDYEEEPSATHIIDPGCELSLPEIKLVNDTHTQLVVRRWRNKNDKRPYVALVGKVVSRI